MRTSSMPAGAPAAAHAVDGLTPSRVVTPASVDELAAALADANGEGLGVIPWGGGRHMTLGNVPARYDVALRTTGLDRVLEYEPADMTVTVEAGITFGALQRHLSEHGQFLPVDAPDDATVGGVLAAGLSGPSRHAYGLPRDWLLGCRVAHAGGTITKGGGRVVKNVAGYDLPRLYVGALGTLGVIVEATFKLAPLPTAQETLVAVFPDLAAAAQAIAAADERGLALRAVSLRDDGKAAFWLAGPAAAVERSKREIAELAGEAKRQELLGDASTHWWAALGEPPEGGVALRASLAPSSVLAFVEAARDAGARALSYPTTGLVLAQLDGATSDRIASLRSAATHAGGTLVVTSAPAELKREIDVWGQIAAVPLMRRLREEFDPKSTINPGRFVGGL